MMHVSMNIKFAELCLGENIRLWKMITFGFVVLPTIGSSNKA